MMKIKFILVISLLFVTASADRDLIYKEVISPIFYDLVNAIKYIFDKFYFSRGITIVIVTAVKDPNDYDVMDMKNLLINSKDRNNSHNIFCMLHNTFVPKIRRFSRTCMVILIDTFESFLQFKGYLMPDRFTLQGYYVFVLLDGIFGDEEMKSMATILLERGVIHFYIIFEKSGYIHYTTTRPYHAKSCDDTSLVYRFVYKNGDFVNGTTPTVLFPKDKFLNLFGCPLRVVTFERCPAMCYEVKKTLSGFDYEVIKAMRQQLNLTLKVQYLPGNEQWGTILPNGSTTGGLDVLRRGEADIGIGNYFLQLSRLELFDSTISYYSVPIVLVIPPPQKFSPFEKLLLPFERIIWILILIIICIGFLVIFIINWKLKGLKNFVFGRGIQSPTMNMFVAIFGLQQTVLPSRNFSRFILMMFLLFCLVNRGLYQGALYIFLQSDGLKDEISSVDEMIEADFKFYMFSTYVGLIDPKSRIYEKKVVIKSDNELPFSKKVDDNLKAAFMTPLTNVINRNQLAKGKYVLHVCKERVSIMSTVIFMKKDFFLKDTFDDLLRRFNDAGLLVYWYDNHALDKYADMTNIEVGPKPLSIEHMFGVFNIMLIGYGVAIIVLLLENAIFRLKKRRNDRKGAAK